MNDTYVAGKDRPVNCDELKKQNNMVDDLRFIVETLQETRKRFCDIGESTGCLGCMTSNLDYNANNAREEIGYIKEMSSIVLDAVRELQKFIG